MKKLILALMMIVVFGSMSVKADTYSHDPNVLPTAAREVLKRNFKAGISVIKIDKDLGVTKDYEVVLTDGSEITFDSKGNWEDVEVAVNKNVPAAFLLQPIRTYVAKNFKGVNVVGVEKNKRNIEVTLANGVELKFDNAGNFIKFDD